MSTKRRRNNNIKYLQLAKRIFEDIKDESKTNKKLQIFTDIYNTDKNNVAKILFYIYDSDKTFHMTPKSILKFRQNKKYDEKESKEYKDLFKLLDDCQNKVISGHLALKSMSEFIKKYKKYEEIIFQILKKKVENGMGVTLYNKVLIGKHKIKVFEVALARLFTDKIYNKYKNDDWYLSRKYDGVRVIALVDMDKKKVEYTSRYGKELKLDIITNSISFPKLKKRGATGRFYLDGELVYFNKDKLEVFQDIMKVIKNPERDQSPIKYVVFDILSVEDFENGKGDTLLSTRMARLKKYIGREHGKIVPVKMFLYNESIKKKLMKNIEKEGWEGLMIRRDTGYEGKRSNSLLKIKTFHDAEFKVTDVVISTIRIRLENGKEKKVPALGAIVINSNGTRVGSGFSFDQRLYYYEHPEKIIGKIVTIKYFGITKDNKLRFPTLKVIHGSERKL